MVLQGIHRKPTQRCTHHPISYKLLQQILHHLKQSYPDLNHTWAMLQTAVSLTFHGLLCVSKFTSPSSRTIIPQCTLSRGDIHFQHNGSILLHVNASKTDQQQVGNHILIGATGTCTCLVYLIRCYLTLCCHHRTNPHCPLFHYHCCHYLTSPTFTKTLRECI